MKPFSKDSATILSMQQSDGTCADNKLDNANMLNNYFSKCFTTSLPPLCDSFESAEHLELPEGGPVMYRGGGYISVLNSTINRCFLKQVALAKFLVGC